MITRRQFIQTTAAAPLALSVNNNASAQTKSKPNIIMILVDDMGWSDIGCFGGEVNTPNLDHMAGKGIRFTQTHNTAKCFPSRACLLTGLYAQQCGMDKKPSHFTNCATLGDVLKTAGYKTFFSGKHHGLDNPYDIGFDRYAGLRDGACNHFNPGQRREGEPEPGRKRNDRSWCFDEKLYQPYTPEDRSFYSTDSFTNYALDFLDTTKSNDDPFFLYLAYTAPHDPLMAWQDDIAKYRGKYKAGYEAIRKQRDQKQREMGLIDERFPQSDATHPDWDNLSEEEKDTEDLKMAVYAAMIDRVDQNIGRLLAKLEELGVADDTLILFASDNGCSAEVVRVDKHKSPSLIGTMARWTSLGGNWANVSNTPFRFFKNYSHEGGICTPMIAYWKNGIENPGRISERIGHFIDIMPTLMDVSGAQYPTEIRGQNVHRYAGESFAPVLKDNGQERSKPIFFQWSRGKAVIYNNWKLVSWRDGGWELYDLSTDKTETNNLAATNPEIVKQYEKMYEEWISMVNF